MSKKTDCPVCGNDPEYVARCGACGGTGRRTKRPRPRRKLERAVESPVVAYARERGVLVRKLNGLGHRDWPDRVFFHDGKTLFIEFKRPGLEPTPSQERLHGLIRAAGFVVQVVDDVEVGKAMIAAWAFGESSPLINMLKVRKVH